MTGPQPTHSRSVRSCRDRRRGAFTPVLGLWVLLVLLDMLSRASADDAAPAASPNPARAPLTVAALKRETVVDFESEVLPFLKNNCLACHNQTKAKGGLNLETPQLILKGGDTGPAVVPHKAAE